MLTFFSVKNFRQFREELVFDFSKVRDYQFNTNCVKNGFVNKAIIYGKNAVGKTNLMEAMRDIVYTTLGSIEGNEKTYRNADSNADEPISFHYSFLLEDVKIEYQYEKMDSINVIAEKLVIDDIIIFEYNRYDSKYDFNNVGIIGAEQLQWDDFCNMRTSEDDTELINSLTALRFAYSNTATSQDTPFKKLVRFILNMRFSTGLGTINSTKATRLLLREIDDFEDKNIKDFEEFLNSLDLGKDDFVFLDPPYDSEFSEYARNSFTRKDQKRLADWAKKTKAKIMIVIKNTGFILNLYSGLGFNISSFDKKYMVNFNNRNDRKVKHLLITNY